MVMENSAWSGDWYSCMEYSTFSAGPVVRIISYVSSHKIVLQYHQLNSNCYIDIHLTKYEANTMCNYTFVTLSLPSNG